MIIYPGRIIHSHRPMIGSYCARWASYRSMNQKSSSHVGYGLNSPFSYSILMCCSNTTESNGLFLDAKWAKNSVDEKVPLSVCSDSILTPLSAASLSSLSIDLIEFAADKDC